jgi:16S rRNA (cytosine967-C5)-methyltransferase
VNRDPRRVALDALHRIEGGAYANLLVPSMLDDSGMPERDRGFVTELVYGTTRMRRACDFLVDRFLVRELDVETRNALRLGAYQLHFLQTPAHAAVSATVEVAPKRSRGLVNAVLRKVAGAPVSWPDDATRLSYPDWIVHRVVADLGRDDGLAALAQMNEAPTVTVRDDGYVQDRASQHVVAALGITPGMRVADTCAGPGGKATGMASAGAWVAAADVQPHRAELVRANAGRLGAEVVVATGDGRRPPFRAACFDRVLVDAPCSGLGVLRRRPDARWRIEPADVTRLAALQRELLDAAISLVAPGGELAYSVCTLTDDETVAVDEWLARDHPHLHPLDAPGGAWRERGRGAILLPQAERTDGMYLLRVGRSAHT